MTRTASFTSGASMLALAFVAGLGTARADIGSLYVGGVYTTGIQMTTTTAGGSTTQSLAGGSIDISSLNGVTLPFLYCVDIPDNVYVGETYSSTLVDNYGYVDNDPTETDPVDSGTLSQLPTVEVEQVAWLLDNYGVGGQGDGAVALQAAIWHVIYTTSTSSFDLATSGNSATAISDYNAEISALGTATSSGAIGTAAPILWLSPAPPANGLTIEQGLVTISPEPASILLLGVFAGVFGLAGLAKRKLA